MGFEELLSALRSEGEKKRDLIRQEADADAARLRDTAAARLARHREESRQEQDRVIAAEESAILAEAERTARRIRLSEVEKLADRLYLLARRLMPGLREKEYSGMFNRLAAELPIAGWETVRVNPADAELAGRLFPAARIEADAGISGGMEAVAAGGRVKVVNTLEKRLERAWPELLPVIIEEVGSGGRTDGSPEPAVI